VTVHLGYALSSEEFRPGDLVRQARLAEEAGFEFAFVSDHFHPWIDRQGHSPFVWPVLGGIARATQRISVGTGVTCPILRVHPAHVAQAAATVADMMPGRFMLGVGTGENLNEHILGQRWPSASERLEMLEEAIELIRKLWEGEIVTHRGPHFTVEDARLYTVPEELPPIVVAAGAPAAAELAGRAGDGLCSTSPSREIVEAYEQAGGDGPRYGQLTVCWAEDEDEARRTAHELWPNAALEGPLTQELPLPAHFEEAAAMVTEDDTAERIVCGPDLDRHLEGVRMFADAGFDHVYVHQVGPDQEGFLDVYADEVMPALSAATSGARA
jgi:G6PDH family F420-dependent oxidoreductase